MAILNRPSHGQPSVLIALWKTLRASGALEEGELIELCTPPSEASNKTQVQQTFNSAVGLGLFDLSGGRVVLAPTFEDLVIDPTQEPLYRDLRDGILVALMRPENNEHFGEAGAEGGRGAADFTYALCWLLELEPRVSWVTGAVFDLQARDFPDETRQPLQNETRWNGMVDWACFVGMGWTIRGGRFHVDPTDAVRGQLGHVFTSEDELGADEFVKRLSVRLPVLDRGAYRSAALERFPQRYARDEPVLSASLSFALTRLEIDGQLTLIHRDDAPAGVLIGPDRPSVTHVRMKIAANV